MLKKIIVGALAGAAVAWLIVEKKNHKIMQKTYDQLGNYFMVMGKKVVNEFEKGKGKAEMLGKQAGKMIQAHIHH